MIIKNIWQNYFFEMHYHLVYVHFNGRLRKQDKILDSKFVNISTINVKLYTYN